jgi:hypothetical protein
VQSLVLNLLCHLVHVALILFVVLGWTLNPDKLDHTLGLAASGIALLSLAVNVPRWLRWVV